MAKKTKRKVSVVDTNTNGTAATPVVESVSTPASSTMASRRSPSFTAEFNPDYSYVMGDLKRIGVIAGSFVVILVALSFFL